MVPGFPFSVFCLNFLSFMSDLSAPRSKPVQKPKSSSIAPSENTADPMENQIELHYTHEILSGKLPPGTRLPSNQSLAGQWSTSCRTIQRAMASLTALGLIERTASRGTFVRSREQQALVGVLMGPSLVDDVSGYYRMIWSALQTELSSAYLSARIYDSLDQSYSSPHRDTQISYLNADLKYHTFTGFIEIATLGVPAGIHPVGYPRAVYEPKREDNDVSYDFEGIGRQIVHDFHRNGVRRLWIFRSSPDPSSRDLEVKAALKAARDLGMPKPEVFNIPAEHEGYYVEKETHDCLIRKLAGLPRRQLPEGLMMTTDVAAKGAVMALLKHGVEIPRQVKIAVVTAENSRVYYSVPVQQYCLPIQKLASSLATVLRDRIAKKTSVETPIILQGWLESEKGS